ncbi:MAG: DNA polymerase III subunit delta [Anaerolineae bacterium]|nr:DNA polymerase III subunit delta [Anaerolineae bacterium]
MSRSAPTFYVLHGPDEFTCRAQVQAMRGQMGDPGTADLNISVFDGKNATAADVLSAARAIPFLGDKRLIIVEGMLSWLTRRGAGKAAKDELAALAEDLADLPPWARVVFVESVTLPDSHPILKLARTVPGGFHKTFDAPRNPARWIVEHARSAYGAEIETAAATALAAVTGDDLHAADSELSKLAAYTGGERPISEADVALLTPYVAEANIFEMVDALGRRDGATAVRLLRGLLADGEPLPIFGMIIRQFRLLIMAREFLNEGGSPRQAGGALGVHPFVGEKVAAQAKAFTQEQLEAIYRHLLDTDLAIKTGKVDAALALDLLIAGIAS